MCDVLKHHMILRCVALPRRGLQGVHPDQPALLEPVALAGTASRPYFFLVVWGACVGGDVSRILKSLRRHLAQQGSGKDLWARVWHGYKLVCTGIEQGDGNDIPKSLGGNAITGVRHNRTEQCVHAMCGQGYGKGVSICAKGYEKHMWARMSAFGYVKRR